MLFSYDTFNDNYPWRIGDIVNVIEGDICPLCGGKLYFKKGIEMTELD